MDRRQFIKIAAVTGAGLGVGYFTVVGGNGYPLTLERAVEQLNHLNGQNLMVTGEWDVAQICNHCAQSVEYSMLGFPEHKSEIFKQTVGTLAFSLFAAKGSMHHSLSEPIPGALRLPANQPIDSALARLKKSLMDFQMYQGQLAPHFAYGELSKADYVKAHVMHLNQHLSQISLSR